MSQPKSKREIRGILLHRCESGLTGDEVRHAEALRGLGYHYFIRKDGTVDQVYDDEMLVWHACRWSKQTIAIAIYGDFQQGSKSVNRVPTNAQLESIKTLCAALLIKHGPLFILGHTDLANASTDPLKVCPGPALKTLDIAHEAYQMALSLTDTDDATPPSSGERQVRIPRDKPVEAHTVPPV